MTFYILDTERAVCIIIQKVQELSVHYPQGTLELQLIGGYADDRQCSEKLFFDIMNTFHKVIDEIAVTLVCVGPLNSTIKGCIKWPVIYGVGVMVKTGKKYSY